MKETYSTAIAEDFIPLKIILKLNNDSAKEYFDITKYVLQIRIVPLDKAAPLIAR